jgi:hypothetical protein
MSDTADEIESVLVKLLREVAELKARNAELQADIDQCPFHGPVARWDLP